MRFIIIMALALAACTSGNESVITGKWMMHQVIQSGKDVTSEHDPYHERYLILRPDSTFESGGRPFGSNTGRYIFDTEENSLFLDSDTGPEDDSYWNIEFNGDTMFWQGYGSAWAEDFVLIQVRAME